MRLAGIVAVLGLIVGCQPSHRSQAADPLRSAPPSPATTRAASPHDDAITVDLDVRLDGRRSVVWCATAQIAWAQFGQHFGGTVSLGPPPSDGPSPVADDATALAMNQFPRAWVDERNIIAEAHMFTPLWLSDVRAMVREQFGDEFETPLLDRLEAVDTSLDIAMYAAMRVRAPFEHSFPTRNHHFGVASDSNHASNGGSETSTLYRSFGIRASSLDDPAIARAAAQVIVHWNTPPERSPDLMGMTENAAIDDATSPDEVGYLIELKTTTPHEHLLLARSGQSTTLRAAIATAMHRFRSPNTKSVDYDKAFEQISQDGRSADDMISLIHELHRADRLGPMDEFVAPLITVRGTRDFPNLLGRPFRSPNALQRYHLAMAGQSIRFTLNEDGASLESEAAGGGLFGGPMRNFDFSEPFVVMLVHDDSPWPYFAAWIGDDTFLVPAPPEEQPEATRESDTE